MPHKDNILISTNATPYLTDFGLSRDLMRTLTRNPSKVGGCTWWMAMEYMGEVYIGPTKPSAVWAFRMTLLVCNMCIISHFIEGQGWQKRWTGTRRLSRWWAWTSHPRWEQPSNRISRGGGQSSLMRKVLLFVCAASQPPIFWPCNSCAYCYFHSHILRIFWGNNMLK